MKFSLDCYPCAVRHALWAVRRAGMNEEMQQRALRQVLQVLVDMDAGDGSHNIMMQTHAIIREMTGIEDIYRQEKVQATQEALSLYDQLKGMISQSRDPFETAVRLSIAGNIIDFGALDGYDLNASIERVLQQPFALNDLDDLRVAVERAQEILYLADNAGETVFDRLLIETIQKKVVYAIKEAPILNDATHEDALAAGLGKVAQIISCGARSPGTLLEYCSHDFRNRFENAELIISKGMGNYEALSDMRAPIFFLLQVKCDLVAGNLGVPKGSIVVARNPR